MKTYRLQWEFLLKQREGVIFFRKKVWKPFWINVFCVNVVKFLPPCLFSLFLPSSFTITSWSKRDNFLFSRTPFSWIQSEGSEDTLFKQSPLAGMSVEFIACADWARFRLPLTGSEVTSAISSFYKKMQQMRVTDFMFLLSLLLSPRIKLKWNCDVLKGLFYCSFKTKPTFNSKTLASKGFFSRT